MGQNQAKQRSEYSTIGFEGSVLRESQIKLRNNKMLRNDQILLFPLQMILHVIQQLMIMKI